MAEVTVTDGNFQSEVVDTPGVVMVDFWAEWCGPCRMLGPIVEELAKENEGKVKVGKLNVDDNPSTASQFGVMSIPTVIFFKDGKVVDKIVGVRPKAEIQQKLDSIVNA